MKKGERQLNNKGDEVMLFPLEYMYISQGENHVSGSHGETLSMDFLGWGPDGRIFKCPYYAPCSATKVASGGADNWVVYNSDKPVELASGEITNICFVVMHDDNPPNFVHVVQGNEIGHSGTTGPNVTGDHVHINIAKGHYEGFEKNPLTGNSQLKNSIHLYDAMFVNDTVLVNDRAYPWKIFEIKYRKIKQKFRWVLYARKLREKN